LPVVGPRRLLGAREHHPFVPVRGPLLRPYVPVPVPGTGIPPRFPEPAVIARGVVHDEVDEHPHATTLRLVDELDEVAARAMSRVDTEVVRDVVAVVAVGGDVEGCEADGTHTQVLQVVQPADQAVEIPHAITVPVEEGLQVETVDDGVLVPEIVDQRGCSSFGRSGGRGGVARMVTGGWR